MKRYDVVLLVKDDTLKICGSTDVTSPDGDWFENLDSVKKFVETKWANHKVDWDDVTDGRYTKSIGRVLNGTTYNSYTIFEYDF